MEKFNWKIFLSQCREIFGQVLPVFALSAGKVGGLYGPWALSAIAVAGGGFAGLWGLLGAALGALCFYDFQSGLRFAASAVLVYCANLALCDHKLTLRPWFAPVLSGGVLLLVQSVYLVGRTASQWALCAAGALFAAAGAWLLRQGASQDRRRIWLMLTALSAAVTPLSAAGFSPGRACGVWMALLCSGSAAPPVALLWGGATGLAIDLAAKTPILLYAVGCGCGACAASLLKEHHRLLQGAACAGIMVLAVLVTDADRSEVLIYEALCGAVAWVLLPRRWRGTAARRAQRGAVSAPEAAVPAMAALRSGGAAYRELYEEMFPPRRQEQSENPAVIFDRAAEEVCRRCVMVKKCWQAEYATTYNAFNDACGAMLRRGRAEPEDFPAYFAHRCLHFPKLLAAIDRGIYSFLLRRQYRTRLDELRRLAQNQYEQMGEAMQTECAEEEREVRLRCRVGSSLRPREGETACGDQISVFTVGQRLYMLLSDGMGTGERAHAESAMTVRLLRRFLKAGIAPYAALKTINTALTLRCEDGGGFTTIDLLSLDRSSGETLLYKYGACPTFVRRGDVVTRFDSGTLPAGLHKSSAPPESTRLQLDSGSVVVMVSDGIVGADGESWLIALLQGWTGADSRELSQLILAESRRHGGLQDDCAALVLRIENMDENSASKV